MGDIQGGHNILVSDLGMTANRLAYICVVAVVTPLGFATKFYTGLGASWVAAYAGGFFYVLFWVFVFLGFAPRSSPRTVALFVFTATSVSEVAQLWHPPFLESIRSTFLGHALLGSTFSWWDFAYYGLAALAAPTIARHARSCFFASMFHGRMSDQSAHNPRASYDAVADDYTSRIAAELQHKPFDRLLLDQFAEQVRDLGWVADIGCGPGHVARYLHDRGVRVVGIDLSPRMVECAPKLHPTIEFRQADMEALPVPNEEHGRGSLVLLAHPCPA